ncbi:MAG: FAD-dependent oxidoreductase [Spirochaetota bacterium]
MDHHETDVVVAGGGTAGVVAAVASARAGARTTLIEAKGYPGGIAVEGGTALHSFYNLWKAFPGVEKRQVVRGIPAELVDRLDAVGGTSGHAEAEIGYDYDSVCTAIDTELYKLVALEMLEQAGVDLWLNTFITGASREGDTIVSVSTAGRTPSEAISARQFIDTTGFGDLAAYAGASFTEPNDYPVANSMGVGGVNVEAYHRWLADQSALSQFVEGTRDGEPGKIVRLDAIGERLPAELVEAAREIGMAFVVTTVHDDYFMFVKLNVHTPESPTRREVLAAAELELRRRQHRAIGLIRRWIPGAERAFIARTSPSVCIRRGRCIECDYDITATDVTSGRHFEDDVAAYGFHDFAPRIQIENGGTYGIPYGALRPKGLGNLLVAGMMITSDHEAHMSTRNTVSCMAQGQAVGTAAALCARRECATRDLQHADLREALVADGVYLE